MTFASANAAADSPVLPDRQRWLPACSAVLSLLFHGLVLWLLWQTRLDEVLTEIVAPVEFVALAELAPAPPEPEVPPPPVPDPPPPPAAAAAEPQVPPPEPPVPAAVAQERPPERAAPPPTPQLQEAPIAERSRPAPAPERPPRPLPPPPPPRPAAQPEPAPAAVADLPATGQGPDAVPVVLPTAPRAGSAVDVRQGPAEPEGGEPRETATQAVQDFILMQIARHWIIDFRAPRFRNLRLTLRFVLLPDGTLGPPFGRTDPWNLPVLVNDFAGLSEAERTAAITFLQAMRQAQPFRLPPEGLSAQARTLPLDFQLGAIGRP